MQSAVSRQNGLAPLLADLAVAVQSPEAPTPVAAAATRVLALQQPLAEMPTGATIKQALAQSGLLLEARIAVDGQPPEADLKSALLVLRQVVQASPATTPAAPSPSSTPPPAPPYRDGPMQAQPPAASNLPADASAETIMHHLAQGADAALARQTLFQLASAPGAPQAVGTSQPVQWMFEIPFAAAQGAAVAQFEIGRDDDEDGQAAAKGEAEPTWRARFSIDIANTGPVHAKISLTGGQARVTLWAERAETAARLSDQQADLSKALLGDDLIASIAVFPGAPNTPKPAAGQFMDRAL